MASISPPCADRFSPGDRESKNPMKIHLKVEFLGSDHFLQPIMLPHTTRAAADPSNTPLVSRFYLLPLQEFIYKVRDCPFRLQSTLSPCNSRVRANLHKLL